MTENDFRIEIEKNDNYTLNLSLDGDPKIGFINFVLPGHKELPTLLERQFITPEHRGKGLVRKLQGQAFDMLLEKNITYFRTYIPDCYIYEPGNLTRTVSPVKEDDFGGFRSAKSLLSPQFSDGTGFLARVHTLRMSFDNQNKNYRIGLSIDYDLTADPIDNSNIDEVVEREIIKVDNAKKLSWKEMSSLEIRI